jgi:acyl carrier protein
MEKPEMTEKDDIAKRVRSRIADPLCVEPDKVVDTASIIDDLDADSLDTVCVVMALEEEFGIEIPDDEADAAITVGDAIKIVRGRVS